MKIKTDKILCVDIEATCYERGTEPDGFLSDIIEIGVCELDVQTLKIGEPEGIIIRPTRSVVSEYCTNLTTLTQADVDKGVSFVNACDILMRKYFSKKRVWCSFGNYDRIQFQKQCSRENVDYPFGVDHINIKTLFALKKRLKSGIGLDRTVALLGYEFEGIHHRGMYDAKNVAKVMAYALQ
jgi:inhibitor of KinA sporulation pathway (predicted exonuclease)